MYKQLVGWDRHIGGGSFLLYKIKGKDDLRKAVDVTGVLKGSARAQSKEKEAREGVDPGYGIQGYLKGLKVSKAK